MIDYRHQLAALRWALIILLATACSSQAQFEVINRGMRGYSVGKVAQAWPKVLKDGPSPDVVVLIVGTNDMINSEYLTPLDTFRNRYDALLDALWKTSKHVVVATLPPCVEEHLFRRHKRELYKGESPTDRIRQANTIIREIAGQKGCALVDLDAVFTPGTWEEGNSQGLLTTVATSGRADGVHPNSAGARKIGEAVAARIKSLGLTGGTIICLGDSITYGGGLPGEGTTEGETYPAVLKQTLKGS
jgi:lysophospholipase L1-like esterase